MQLPLWVFSLVSIFYDPPPPSSNEAWRFLKPSETLPVSVERCVLSVRGGEYDKSVNTSVILALRGGCRATPARGMAAPGGRSSPGEHETGLPANMQTATFLFQPLLDETARLLAASFYPLGLARRGADSALT